MPSVGGDDLVVGQRSRRRGEPEAVADLHPLDRLDAHQRGREPGVEPSVPVHVGAEPRRQAVHDHLDDAAEGVAVLVGLVDLGHHRLRGVGVEAADWVVVEAGHVVRSGHGAVRRLRRADPHHVRHDPGVEGLVEERGRHRTERHPGRGLAGRRAFQDRPGLVPAVLLHADQVGVTGPRPGQRGVAGQRLELHRVDRVGGHHLLPLRPLGVADDDRHRAAEGLAVPDAAGQRHLVLLELHPGAAAVAEPAPREGVGDVGGGDPDVRGQPLDDRGERGSVGLPGGEPAQHGVSVSRSCSAPEPALSTARPTPATVRAARPSRRPPA